MGGAAGKLKGIDKTNPNNDWIVLGDLGAGTYGKVHRVRHRENGQYDVDSMTSFDIRQVPLPLQRWPRYLPRKS